MLKKARRSGLKFCFMVDYTSGERDYGELHRRLPQRRLSLLCNLYVIYYLLSAKVHFFDMGNFFFNSHWPAGLPPSLFRHGSLAVLDIMTKGVFWCPDVTKKRSALTCQCALYPGRDLNPHALASSRFWVYRVYHSTTRANQFWIMNCELCSSEFNFQHSNMTLKSGAKVHTFFDMEKFFFVEPIILCIFAFVFNG